MGLSDQDNKYKAKADGLIDAAQKLAAAKDYDAAKNGMATLQAAAKGDGKSASNLKWAKLASLRRPVARSPR